MVKLFDKKNGKIENALDIIGWLRSLTMVVFLNLVPDLISASKALRAEEELGLLDKAEDDNRVEDDDGSERTPVPEFPPNMGGGGGGGGGGSVDIFQFNSIQQ